MLKIYTDGACSGNPGPGGWAFIIPDLGVEKNGYDDNTTNNRMEITAVYEALKYIYENFPEKLGSKIEIITDSQYIVNTMTKGWNKNKNLDLWGALEYYLFYFIGDIKWSWVKGHANDKYNQRCDKLAVEAYTEYQNTKQKEANRKKYEALHKYDDCYDTEIPLITTSPQTTITIALTAYKRYTIKEHTYTIFKCTGLPGLYVIEKNFCELIYHGTLDNCMAMLKDIKDPNALPF